MSSCTDGSLPIDDVENRFFGARQRFRIFFTGPADGREADPLFESFLEHATGDLEGVDAATQIKAVAGLFPVLFVTYDLRFPRPLRAEELWDYLVQSNEEVAFRYSVAFVNAVELVRLRRIFADLLTRREIGRVQSDVGFSYFSACENGERLLCCIFANEPVPDERPEA